LRIGLAGRALSRFVNHPKDSSRLGLRQIDMLIPMGKIDNDIQYCHDSSPEINQLHIKVSTIVRVASTYFGTGHLHFRPGVDRGVRDQVPRQG
jgi:hypothetical protein